MKAFLTGDGLCRIPLGRIWRQPLGEQAFHVSRFPFYPRDGSTSLYGLKKSNETRGDRQAWRREMVSFATHFVSRAPDAIGSRPYFSMIISALSFHCIHEYSLNEMCEEVKLLTPFGEVPGWNLGGDSDYLHSDFTSFSSLLARKLRHSTYPKLGNDLFLLYPLWFLLR